MKARLAKLSVCECGYSALKEHIPLGTEFEVEPERTHAFTWICGGCGQSQPVEGIFVLARGASRAGYLPRQLFQLVVGRFDDVIPVDPPQTYET